MSEPSHLQNLLEALLHGEVEFVLIGGLALTAHGGSRVTEDVDVLYARHATNQARLVAALQPLAPRLRGGELLPFSFDASAVAQGLNFSLVTRLGDLDIFGELPGVGTYEAAVANSVEMLLFGLPIKVLGLAELEACKRAAGRAKDLIDLAEIASLRQR